MEPNECIRYLRKEHLKLTLDEFSKRLNISRSNLSNIETGRISLTNRVLSDICREFHVNPDWIMNGVSPMFQENTELMEGEIAKLYFNLTEENKRYLYGYMKQLLKEQADS